MAESFETLGITVLVNETQTIGRSEGELHLVGTDDVHYYYTDDAHAALVFAPEGFKIALIHSAVLADVAAESGFQLSQPGTLPVAKSACLEAGLYSPA